MMKTMLSAIGLVCAAATFSLMAGAQEAGTNPAAPSTNNAVGSRASLSERVRALLAAAGVEVGVVNATQPARAHRELKINWEADKNALPAPARAQNRNAPGRVALASAPVRRDGALPKQRSAELSPTQVVVVALDAEGRMLWCGLVADPRLLRAETAGPDGELTGHIIYRESAEFVVHYPDDEAITEVRLYHPDWDGQRFTLAPVGAVAAR
ncbi:MAG TPA: hypothetical protein VF297_12870 [Pyrinomonadaceae bacterium]